MTTLELDQHPELAVLVTALRHGETIAITEHGRPLGRCVPTGTTLHERLEALHRGFTSPAYTGNSVIDDRQASR